MKNDDINENDGLERSSWEPLLVRRTLAEDGKFVGCEVQDTDGRIRRLMPGATFKLEIYVREQDGAVVVFTGSTLVRP